MYKDEILLLPATEITSRVQPGEISAVELKEMSLDQIATGEHLPLAGLPFAVKDHIWLAGVSATNGS
jgi:Asp-tRNA(Asn)/Glu-tRNA(Gln) amidotransferase A subunit family amidase